MQSIPPARRRKLRTWIQGEGPAELIASGECGPTKPLLDLASNDYLGLSKHPKLKEEASAIISTDGVGAGASRLIT